VFDAIGETHMITLMLLKYLDCKCPMQFKNLITKPHVFYHIGKTLICRAQKQDATNKKYIIENQLKLETNFF
jgi:hypothetical protein